MLVSFTVRHLDRMDHAVNRMVHICDPAYMQFSGVAERQTGEDARILSVFRLLAFVRVLC